MDLDHDHYKRLGALKFCKTEALADEIERIYIKLTSPQKKKKKRKRKRKKRLSKKRALSATINQIIRKSINNNANSQALYNYAGYTTKQAKRRLMQTIPEGYVWEDFKKGKLHIDHIIPVKVHNFNTIEDIDFKKCFDLKNLQLLPARDNRKKSAKITKPFQPSLAFGGYKK